MTPCFVTDCYWVNLRSAPNPNDLTTIIAALPYSHECTLLNDSNTWWHVKTEVDDVPLEGFVHSRYLSLSQDSIGRRDRITEVHLREERGFITPNYDGGRASPLGDPNRVVRDMSSVETKVSSTHDIIDYLDVENTVRYQKKGNKTYCNVYAYDFCYLSGAYIPRVWWTGQSLIKLSQGQSVPIEYGETVTEIRANELFFWLKDFGPTFGWRRVFTAQELQDNSDRGGIGIIVANTKDHGAAGHICVVVPQTNEHKPVLTDGQVTTPVMSQAGGSNYKYRAYKWWTNRRFSFFGFFIHD